MAQWRKVVVSGSSAVLNQVSASGNIVPKTTDGSSLGTSTLQFSDLFLGEGAVINWDGGDFTATQTNNLLALSGGNTRVDRLEVDSANDYLDVDTDLKIVAAADITLDPGGNNVKPGGDSADDLGVSGTAWRTLYVDAIEMNGQGAIAGVTHVTASGNISGSAASSGSFGYLKVSGDGVFGGDITFGDANTDSVSFGADISSDLIPNADDTYDLGSASQAWQDLFLEGDITLTDAGKLVSSAGNLTVDSEAATLVLDGHTGVDIDASNSGKVAIDGAGGIDIGVAADVAIDVDASTFDLDASGALTMTSTTMALDPSSTFDLDAAGAITIDGASITLGGDSDTAFDIDTSTLDIDSSGAVTIDSTSTIAISGDGGATFSDDTEAIIYDGCGNLDIDSVALDIDASGAVTIDSTSTILISGDGGATFSDDTEALVYDGSGNVDFDTVALDIDSSGAITIDGTSTFSVDVQGATNIDTTSGAISIGTANSGIAVNIGHSTSETTINDNLTITGDLTVNGDQTIVSTTNLAVEDKFAIFASGSTSDTDGGIIVQNAASAGYALGYDSGVDRWAFDADLAHNATNLVPDAYVGVVQVGTTHGDSVAVPTYGGTTNGVGTIYVDTDDNEIWIYA